MYGLNRIPTNAQEARLIVEGLRVRIPGCNAFEECKKLAEWTWRLSDHEKAHVKALFEAARFL